MHLGKLLTYIYEYTHYTEHYNRQIYQIYEHNYIIILKHNAVGQTFKNPVNTSYSFYSFCVHYNTHRQTLHSS